MKMRNGFVSNSSSSSFVVIGNGVHQTLKPDENGILVVGPDVGGTSEFGWEVVDHDDIFSRINFAYLQSRENEGWRNMWFDVLLKQTDVKHVVWVPNEDEFYPDGYIDHASAACEGENTEIFDNEEALTNFIFAEDSNIHTDNDNY